MLVWLNGAFVDRNHAKVSVFDAGFQHGVGLFETMLARNGRVFRLMAHLQRLAASARALRLSDRLRLAPLAQAVQQTLERNAMDAARIRLTVTGGDLNMLEAKGASVQDPTLLIVVQPPTAYPDAFFEDGVVVRIADFRLNPLSPMAGHKTLNYWPRIHALQQAVGLGAGEVIWLTVSNHLASGSVSNVFLVKDGRLRTPVARGEEVDGALTAPVLPGITRSVVHEIAAQHDLPAERAMLDIDELLGADEVFLTNSSWGILPVTGVERETIGDGAVGPVTRRLRQAWLDIVESETSNERS